MGTSDKNTKHLERRGQTWHAVQYVPRDLIVTMDKRKLVQSLHTRDIAIARARRHEVLAQWHTLFETVRKTGNAPGADKPASTDRPPAWHALAARWQQGFARPGSLWTSRTPLPDQSAADNALQVAYAVLDEQAEDIEIAHGAHGADVANAFVGIATGTATPLLHHLESWLAEGGRKGPLNPRTGAQYRADLKRFAKWCRGAGVPQTIEAVTKSVAGRYITEELVQKKTDPGTANRKITAASSYWKWLLKRTAATVNPWERQLLSKPSKAKVERPKRPFTDVEVMTLLNGDAKSEMQDAMRVAALSGMRLEEIYRLTVADCTDGWFVVNRAKTEAGLRRIPVHPDLVDIVTRRCQGKAGNAYLFRESAREGRQRGSLMSQDFSQYRQRCGVHDKAEGKRQSRVDFHSWRRWFITKARNAGIDRAVVAAVVGHEAGNLTDDVYHGGPSDELLRACVEAVKLPL